jgi:hypothetical protein
VLSLQKWPGSFCEGDDGRVIVVRLHALVQVDQVGGASNRCRLRDPWERLRRDVARLRELALVEKAGGEDDAGEGTAAGVLLGTCGQALCGVLVRMRGLVQVAEAVGELVGQFGLVEVADPGGSVPKNGLGCTAGSVGAVRARDPPGGQMSPESPLW